MIAEFGNLSGPLITVPFTIVVRAPRTCRWPRTRRPPRISPSLSLRMLLQSVLLPSIAGEWNKARVIASMLFGWSAATALTALATSYWQVALVRVAQGVFQAGCTPFAAGLMTSYFPPHINGAAMSIYNVGIYAGAPVSPAVHTHTSAMICMLLHRLPHRAERWHELDR